MAQGGDPTGTGTGGSKLPDLPAEFTTKRHFLRGTCGMARTPGPEQRQQPVLHHVRARPQPGRQVHDLGPGGSGMEYVDKIKRGIRPNGGTVANPDRIVRMRVAADVGK